MLSLEVRNIAIDQPHQQLLSIADLHNSKGQTAGDGVEKLGVREKKECGQDRDNIVSTQLAYEGNLPACNDDDGSQEPDV